MGARAYVQPHFTHHDFKKQCPNTKKDTPTHRCRNKAFCDRAGQSQLRIERDKFIELLAGEKKVATQAIRDQARDIAWYSCCGPCREAGRDGEVADKILQSLEPVGMPADYQKSPRTVGRSPLEGRAAHQLEQIAPCIAEGEVSVLGKEYMVAAVHVPFGAGNPVHTPLAYSTHVGGFMFQEVPRAPEKPGIDQTTISAFSDENVFQSSKKALKKSNTPPSAREFSLPSNGIKKETPFSDDNPFQSCKQAPQKANPPPSPQDPREIKEESPFSNENCFQSSSSQSKKKKKKKKTPCIKKEPLEDSPRWSESSSHTFKPVRSNQVVPAKNTPPSFNKRIAVHGPEAHIPSSTQSSISSPFASSPTIHNDQATTLSAQLDDANAQIAALEIRLIDGQERCAELEARARRYKRKFHLLRTVVQIFQDKVNSAIREDDELDGQLDETFKYQKKYHLLSRLFKVFESRMEEEL